MTTSASRGMKTIVGISTSTSASTSDTIGQLISAGGPDQSVEDIDITNFDSPSAAREHLSGMIEGGELKISMLMNKAKQTTLVSLFSSTAATSRAASVLIKFEDSGNFLCQGYLNALGIESAGEKDAVKASIGWKVSGLPTFATS